MLRFDYLPAFASWLLTHIDDYTREILRLFHLANLPLLQALNHLSDEEKFRFSKRLNIEFLTNLSQNNASGHIEAVTARWLSDSFENIGRGDVNANDITIINHVRSKAQKKFINQYTADPELVYQLHSEIDELSFVYNAQSFNDYLRVLRDKIEAEVHFSRNVIEASPGIVYIYDLDQQREVYINGRVQELTGFTPREVLDETNLLLKLTYPEDVPVVADFFRQLQLDKEGQTFNADYRFKMKSGEYRWMRSYAVVSKRKASGEPLQVLGTAYDISRQKEMAIELRRSNEQLQEFAAIASHDLKEPLRKIGLFANLIITTEWDKLPEGAKINLEKISGAANRMQQLIEGVLAYSAIHAQTQKETVLLENLLQEAINSLEYQVAESGAVITSDGLPEADVIPLQIQQLFQNLLSNSLKFSHQQTPLHISVTHTILSGNALKDKALQTAHQYLQIQITDNGIGFDDSAAEKIFGLFQRLHKRSDFEGSGIGLAICKRIVEHHGGIISASSEQGKGAQFTVVLPLKEK